MEGQEGIKIETVTNEAIADEVKNEGNDSVSKIEEKAAKEISEGLSTEILLKKIKDQVEYYFGDVNMQRDKFLIQQTKLDDGWVPMNVMLNFNMLAALTTDVDLTLKALESSDLMEISEDKKKIRRSPKYPLPIYDEEYRKAQEARTVYLKGFPLQNTSIQGLKSFFAAFEPVENIIMRKYQGKEKKFHFKGSVFVQFKTLEDAKAFMDRKSVMYEGTELVRKWSVDYSLEKAKEMEEKKKKRIEMKGKKNEAVSVKGKNSDEEEVVKEISLPKGSIIHFQNVPEKCTREDIRSHIKDADIAFIDFNIGDKEGWIRLRGENAAAAVLEKLEDAQLHIRGQSVVCRCLKDEEEEEYLAKVKTEMLLSRPKNSTGDKHRNKKNRNGHRGQRKRRNSDSNNSVPAKIAALD